MKRRLKSIPTFAVVMILALAVAAWGQEISGLSGIGGGNLYYPAINEILLLKNIWQSEGKEERVWAFSPREEGEWPIFGPHTLPCRGLNARPAWKNIRSGNAHEDKRCTTTCTKHCIKIDDKEYCYETCIETCIESEMFVAVQGNSFVEVSLDETALFDFSPKFPEKDNLVWGDRGPTPAPHSRGELPNGCP